MSRQISSTRVEFSHRTRAYNLARLRAELFDILIIGGGITGAAIAREAALRGLKVALVERNDFACGSTSQSSKLIHGGIERLIGGRYRLLLQTTRERSILSRIAPDQVRSIPFIFPVVQDGPYDVNRVRQGLWLYDALALFRNAGPHQILTAEQVTAEIPELDLQRVRGGGLFYEAQADDVRLTLETVRSAYRHGAVIVNHFRVEEMLRTTGKRVDGACGTDLLSGDFVNVRARVVVNATGPWSDALLTADDPGHGPHLALYKGVHLLVSRDRFPVGEGIAFAVPGERRLMFVAPLERFTLIGPLMSEYVGSPDEVAAEPQDVDEILNAANDFFPRLQLARSEIISTLAGIWPRLARGGRGPFSLDQAFAVTPNGLVTVAGATLTTHRAVAEQFVNRIARILKKDFGVGLLKPSRSARLPLIEWSGKGEVLNSQQANVLESLPEETQQYLVRTYGLRLGRLLDYVRSDAKLRAPIVDGYPYLWAEIPHSVEHEMAMTVEDIMMRRLDLFHQVADGAVEAAREVARYMSRLVDWLDPDIEHEVEAYAWAVALNRRALIGSVRRQGGGE